MRLSFRTFITVLAFLSLGASSAQASVFLWQSEDQRIGVSFPDRWARIHNQRPSDILTVKAPGDRDFATCTVSAHPDGRFKVYPFHYAADIQKQYYSEDMWRLHFDGQTKPVLHQVLDGAQLGDGYASMVSVTYETATGPKMMKRGIAFASLYGGQLYMVECSAQEDAYPRWHKAFLSFVKSVDFKRTTNHALSGYYRNFIADCLIKIRGPRLLEDTYH